VWNHCWHSDSHTNQVHITFDARRADYGR
jgi:hypothetical protein